MNDVTISSDTSIALLESTKDKLGHSFAEVSNKMVETTAELCEKTVDTAKKYPLHTALVAGAVGLIAGASISRK